jgi:hypothetical protein
MQVSNNYSSKGQEAARPEFNALTDASWKGPFWFAVLSPVLGILTGFLTLVFFSS